MALALALTALIGLALGAFGGGGSTLAVPVLKYALGLGPKAAIATSLIVVSVTSAVAAVPLARSGLLRVRTGLVFGASGMIGAFAGGAFARFVPGTLLLLVLALSMGITAAVMLRGRPEALEPATATPERRSRSALRIVAHGLGVGAFTGLVGAGGGFLIVPALVVLGGLPMREAVGTSLFVIAMKSFAGFLGYAGHVSIDPVLTAQIAAVAVLGSLLGSVVVKRAPPAALRTAFAWFVLAAAVFVVSRELPDVVRNSNAYRAVLVGRWPFWAGGIGIFAVVLGLLFVENVALGISTGYRELCRLPRRRSLSKSWRPGFLLGVVLGGTLSTVLSGSMPELAMGALDSIAGGSAIRRSLLLLLGGVLIGFGARLAGGCTSGHGIVGTALGARSSLIA